MARLEAIGPLVRRLRDERGYTQGQVVEYVNARLEKANERLRLTREWLSFVETGRIDKPELERLEALAGTLGVPAANLLSAAGYRATPLPVADPDPVDLIRQALARIEREPTLDMMFKGYERLSEAEARQFMDWALAQRRKQDASDADPDA